MKIHETMLHASQWTQGALASDSNGLSVSTHNPLAVKFCLAGWMLRCYTNIVEFNAICDKLVKHLGESPIFWNDVSTRTFEEVQNLTKELDI